MKVKLIFFLANSILLLFGRLLAAQEAEHSVEFLSPTYTVDRIYPSMTGPQSTQEVFLLKTEKPELLWVRGYRAVMVGPDGKAPALQEFMCHSNLDFSDVKHHNQLLGENPNISSRIFTLSQGQFEIKFPEGFGLPVMSHESFQLTTQVLNHNIKEESFQVRHKIVMDFVRDKDLRKPLKPLFTAAVYGLNLVDQGRDAYFDVLLPNEAQHGPGCLVGKPASDNLYEDAFGRKFTGHWVVKPGREVNRTLVTKLMDLEYDTTIHYIAVHLHPLAESLELKDLTTGQSIFKSEARNFEGRIGLDHVDYFSSSEGVPVFKDHEYELTSVYHNRTSVDRDSMAVMYIYFLDKKFRAPETNLSERGR